MHTIQGKFLVQENMVRYDYERMMRVSMTERRRNDR